MYVGIRRGHSAPWTPAQLEENQGCSSGGLLPMVENQVHRHTARKGDLKDEPGFHKNNSAQAPFFLPEMADGWNDLGRYSQFSGQL